MADLVFSGHDYLVVMTATVLMVMNLLGAAFTIRRLRTRTRGAADHGSIASRHTISNATPLKFFCAASLSITLLVIIGLSTSEGSQIAAISKYIYAVVTGRP